MSKPVNYISRFIRWILPLLALLLIALYLVLSPGLFTHAAAPTTHPHMAAPYTSAPEVQPDVYWPFN